MASRDIDGESHDPAEDLDAFLEPNLPLTRSDPSREAAIAAM